MNAKKKKVTKKTRRTSHMKGRKISLEDRGPNAPKLGRKFEIADETEVHKISLTLAKGNMSKLLKEYDLQSKSLLVRKLIEEKIEELDL